MKVCERFENLLKFCSFTFLVPLKETSREASTQKILTHAAAIQQDDFRRLDAMIINIEESKQLGINSAAQLAVQNDQLLRTEEGNSISNIRNLIEKSNQNVHRYAHNAKCFERGISRTPISCPKIDNRQICDGIAVFDCYWCYCNYHI